MKQLASYTENLLASHKRIIKPWKKRVYGVQKDTSWESRYVEGWNDCLKEIEKNHKSFLKKLPSKIQSV